MKNLVKSIILFKVFIVLHFSVFCALSTMDKFFAVFVALIGVSSAGVLHAGLYAPAAISHGYALNYGYVYQPYVKHVAVAAAPVVTKVYQPAPVIKRVVHTPPVKATLVKKTTVVKPVTVVKATPVVKAYPVAKVATVAVKPVVKVVPHYTYVPAYKTVVSPGYAASYPYLSYPFFKK